LTDTPNLNFPYIMAAQAQKHVTHNEAIRALDAIVQLAVLDRDLTAPPVSPVEGDRYIVASGATGAWASHDRDIAAYQDGAWMLYAPGEGWLAWVADEDTLVAWDGAGWIAAGAGSLNPAPLVGVNATADATNRLSVSAPATMLSHEGAGHQVKVNKSAVSDTASLLFQTGFSGRAEMGLAGDDDFHVKVSPDGAAWTEAVVIDKGSGRVAVGAATPLARFHVNMADADAGLAFLMTGYARDDSNDAANGAAIAMGHNSSGNRQIILADSEAGIGIRVAALGGAGLLDGYNFISNARIPLAIGNSTMPISLVATEISVRNQGTEPASSPQNLFKLQSFPASPSAGVGVSIKSSLRTSSGHIEDPAHIFEMICTDGTLDAEETAFVFKVMAAGAAAAERARIDQHGVRAGAFALTDGVTAPSATAGLAKIFVDAADGDLKVIFGDGTVKTIVTDA
jgi:hypothetical protein